MVTEIVGGKNYYPFGLRHEGYNDGTSPLGNPTAKKFGYNGQELEKVLGLEVYEMGVRQYDPAMTRIWMGFKL